MGSEHNPLIPVWYDIAWSVTVAAVIVFTIVGLVLLARAASRLSTTQAVVWTAVILLVPVLGSLSWIAVGRRALVADRR
ncbi:PLDc N-terminal domain-containing protein [Microbacterium sp. NPDC055357]